MGKERRSLMTLKARLQAAISSCGIEGARLTDEEIQEMWKDMVVKEGYKWKKEYVLRLKAYDEE